MENCQNCIHINRCAINVREYLPVLCENQNGQRQQIKRQIQQWINDQRPQYITTSLIAAQFGFTRRQAEYALRALSKKGVVEVIERRARYEVIYRSA